LLISALFTRSFLIGYKEEICFKYLAGP